MLIYECRQARDSRVPERILRKGRKSMVDLKKLTEKNIWAILELKVAKEQENYVATNVQSIAEAYLTLADGGRVFPFGIFDGEQPVGFLMIGYGCDGEQDEYPRIAENNYCLWRLMIDSRFQGRGYGREAIRLALDFIRTWPCGKAEYCYLGYEPENAVAKRLYNSMGFYENGELDGDEIVAVKKL